MRVNTIRGCTLLFLHYLLTQTKAEFKKFSWKNTGPGKRITTSTAVLLTSDQTSLILCSMKCALIPECLAFNYGGPSRTCELLNTTPIVSGLSSAADAIDWNIYTYTEPKKCPTGGIAVTYDIPNNQGGPTVEGYTCSQQLWIVQQMGTGKKACHMVLHPNTDVNGNDASQYSGKPNPYHEAFRNCFNNYCAAVACNGAFDFCWLKTVPFEFSGKVMDPNNNRNYWTTVCQ